MAGKLDALIIDALDHVLLSKLTITMSALKEIIDSGSQCTSGDGHADAIRLARTALARAGGVSTNSQGADAVDPVAASQHEPTTRA